MIIKSLFIKPSFLKNVNEFRLYLTFMRIIIGLCTLLLTVNCASQHTSLKISLLSLVDDPSFPTIQCGIEFPLGKKLSWYNEAGIKYRKSYYETADTAFVRSRGFKLRSEIRYYLTASHDLYLAINGFYTNDDHNAETGYYYGGDSLDYRTDNFSARKIVKGFNVIAGKSYKACGRFNFEVYAGLGSRFVSPTSDNIEIDHTKDILRRRPDLNIPDNRILVDVQGKDLVLPNFSFGIRLSLML